ncbi:MAG: hypothetical protein SF053_09080 [Bacteroidia bacterium]|nr:hypothetical protein [Bacteroidia bacterium]
MTKRLTYSLVLLAVAIVASVSLIRINKRSFYHHYFRVITAVSLRNTQPVAGQETGIWHSSQTCQTLISNPAQTAGPALCIYTDVSMPIPVREEQIVQAPAPAPGLWAWAGHVHGPRAP